MSSLYTSNWLSLGTDVFYRKTELYPLDWCRQYGINLLDFKVNMAPYGGSIVLTRKETKSSGQFGDISDAFVFSPSGVLMSTIKGAAKNSVLMFWTSKEDVVSLKLDGQVIVYSIHGIIKQSFYLDEELKEAKVAECVTFLSPQGTGLAILSTASRFILINNVYDPKIRKLADVPATEIPTAWGVMSESSSETKVIISCLSGTYVLSSREKTCLPIAVETSAPLSNISKISISADSSRIGMFSDNGWLWLGTMRDGLLFRFCEFDTKCKLAPGQLLWAGDNALVGLWKTVLLVVGLEKNWFNYVIDAPVMLFEEIDGIRIIGHDSHDFLELVPEVTVDVFRIGALSAGALLLEAYKAFESKTSKADEYLKMLRERNNIRMAVEQCIDAAGNEFKPSDQKILLRAATFGKCFIADQCREKFVRMCQELRVLNNVRETSIAIPLTYRQLESLTMSILLKRLILRRHYGSAIRICEYLNIPEEEGSLKILGNWASNKVQEFHHDDDKVASLIFDKLGHKTGISYSEVANEAIKYGRKQLAIRLLDFETRASQQVPLLLLLDQDKKALTRAIESGDTHLIYTVIYRLRDSLPSREFSMLIRNFPAAYTLYQNLCKEEDPEKLKALFHQEDDFNAEASCWISEAFSKDRIDERRSCLKSAVDSFKKAGNSFSASQAEEELKLLTYQERLKQSIRLECVGDSVQKTMEKLLTAKQYKLAEDLKKEFKVPDKRFWWLKVTTLVNESEWIELEKFSKTKKPPIGFEPFVDLCLKANNRYEAQKYAPKTSEDNRVVYLVKVGMYEDAAKWSLEKREPEAYDYVLGKCPPAMKHRVEAIAQAFAKR
ncbi:Vacuolar protein sorting-associated protein 16 -like protein [Halotydeus destructor]|nr:Vacuolar protein sorting-associated protein 16 -like protein [Halotydeus destructor]